MTVYNRREFIKVFSALTGTAVFVPIAFADKVPADAKLLADSAIQWVSVDQLSDDYVVFNDNPINAYTPSYMLEPDVTPANVMFIRNNGKLPDFKSIKPDTWTLAINGESVKTGKSYSIAELKKRFKKYSYQLVLECGGNGRSGFYPTTSGNQWLQTAVHNAEWTGARLADILNDCGVKEDAVYIGYHGADQHLSGEGEAISRGVPIAAALDPHSLVAWSMNGGDIPYLHGYPLRLVFGGRPASCSGKWLRSISIRNKVHDGRKMEVPSYQVPRYPIAPGEQVPDDAYRIMETMIVKSIITLPKSGLVVKPETKFPVRGHAWAGTRKVTQVDVSIDYGEHWMPAVLEDPPNPNAWQRWSLEVSLPQHGYYEIWARATDDKGDRQPMVIPDWNPKGYYNNACERIAVRAEA